VLSNPPVCEACTTGTFTDTIEQETCGGRADCPAGTRITNPDAVDADSNCIACAAGTFTDTPNQETCVHRAACPAGTRITDPDAVNRDSICVDCPRGTFTNTTNSERCAARATCPTDTRRTNPNVVHEDSNCELCVPGTFTDATNQEDCVASTSTATPVNAIVGGIASVPLAFLVLFAIFRCRQRQKKPRRQLILAPANTPLPREGALQWDNPTYAVTGSRMADNQWIMSLGTSPSAKAFAPHVYDKPEYADMPAVYELPVRAAALSTVSSLAAGYAPLSRDHKRDPDAHAGEATRRPSPLSASGAATVYAMLDGTQQPYARPDGGADTDSSHDTESMPGLYTAVAAGSNGDATLTKPASERRPTLFTPPPRRVLGMVADEEA
jgi:hypothetical protein